LQSLQKFFKLNSKDYRQSLAKLRARIEVVETLMSAGEWDKINYEHVPSKAMKQYIKAFKKHDEARYRTYIQSVAKGEAKINAATLYPYDLVRQVLRDSSNAEELDELWKHLPNYFEDSTSENVMCVVDVSGSMYSGRSEVRPIDVAISLGLYMAERAKGPFNNHFITFSSHPELVKVSGCDLASKVNNMTRANWGGSTDILKTFELILNVGKKYSLDESEMPKKLFIISDMQFNEADNRLTTFEHIDKMYAEAGYKRPDLVFWNVNAHSDNPVEKDEKGTFLVSGMSPTILMNALNTKATTALQLMLEVLGKDRYKEVV